MNEPQKGKDQCDRDSDPARNALRRYVDEGNDVTSAIVGTPPPFPPHSLLKGGRIFQKLSHLGEVQKFFARKGEEN